MEVMERQSAVYPRHVQRVRSTFGANPRLSLVCAYAILNPVVTQLAYLLSGNSTDEGLSVLQLFQGAFIAVAAVLSLRGGGSAGRAGKATLRLLVFAVLTFSVFLLKKVAWGSPDRSGIGFDLVWYSKIVAWPFWWWFVASAVQRREHAERLLRTIVYGALIAAVFAIVCYVTGIGVIEAYEYEGVTASVGAAGVSSKQTVAYLAPAAFVSAYLWRSRRRWFGTIGALLLVAATLLTYDRSVQVGLAVALAWLVVWKMLLARDRTSARSTRLFALAVVFGIALFWYVGFDSLVARWSYDLDKGMVGSGRSDFYLAAWLWFTHLNPLDFLLGIGMADVTRVMYETVGRQVHTHSDLFDMLLGGGLLGISFYCYVWRTVSRYFYGVSRRTLDFAIMGAYVVIVGTMSVVTGLLAAPHAMFCLGAALHCIRVTAIQADATADATVCSSGPFGYSTFRTEGLQT